MGWHDFITQKFHFLTLRTSLWPQWIRLQGLVSIIPASPLCPVLLRLLCCRLGWHGSGIFGRLTSGRGCCTAADASALPGWHWLTLLELLNPTGLPSGEVGLCAIGLRVEVNLPVKQWCEISRISFPAEMAELCIPPHTVIRFPVLQQVPQNHSVPEYTSGAHPLHHSRAHFLASMDSILSPAQWPTESHPRSPETQGGMSHANDAMQYIHFVPVSSFLFVWNLLIVYTVILMRNFITVLLLWMTF